ncbi:hypothetical protein H5J22_03240 [Cetobacterium sp. 8H]|uniref:hypothetical protein n=1 Tax=Cetobacterium sp. 8H TaxID=2759681 RepID=UPI00163B6275|nr:hypothetical protein [Cetobacterium sp. 8H]MBC2850459.1 hypothetical protein [Cetobacterium sp. 8H]
MSKKIAIDQFEKYIISCIDEMKTGEKVIFTKDENPLTKDKKITLIKTDDNTFNILEDGVNDFEFSNLDFNGVIKHLLEIQPKEFPDCTHIYSHRG